MSPDLSFFRSPLEVTPNPVTLKSVAVNARVFQLLEEVSPVTTAFPVP